MLQGSKPRCKIAETHKPCENLIEAYDHTNCLQRQTMQTLANWTTSGLISKSATIKTSKSAMTGCGHPALILQIIECYFA